MIEIRTREEIERDLAAGCDQATSPSNMAVIYYGPHACEECGALICRVALEQGGDKFDYPTGIFYPNTQWNHHECRQAAVQTQEPSELKKD